MGSSSFRTRISVLAAFVAHGSSALLHERHTLRIEVVHMMFDVSVDGLKVRPRYGPRAPIRTPGRLAQSDFIVAGTGDNGRANMLNFDRFCLLSIHSRSSDFCMISTASSAKRRHWLDVHQIHHRCLLTVQQVQHITLHTSHSLSVMLTAWHMAHVTILRFSEGAVSPAGIAAVLSSSSDSAAM